MGVPGESEHTLRMVATHASGKVLRAWKDRCKPYSINILTFWGETHSSGVDTHLDTKVLDTGSVKMKERTKYYKSTSQRLTQ